MTFDIRPATRQGIKPLIALYAESGCGKTYSSLLLARGLAGSSGKICMIDTESGRGSLYADVLPGGYDVLQLEPPFSPQRYLDAMKAVEDAGAVVGILDSGSHEWEGEGGVLDMASDNEAKSGKPGLHVWKAPKLAHGLWVRGLLRSRVPWIVCLRAKYKSRQGKNEQGKTVIIKDDHVSPLQAEDFIFEATAHAEILPDHSLRLTKWSHPTLRDCFPKFGPITIETGQLLARWCAAPSHNGTAAVPSPTAHPPAPAGASTVGAVPGTKKPTSPETPEARRARWVEKLKAAGGGHGSYALEYAVEQDILLDTEALEDWPIAKLPKTKAEATLILNAVAQKAGVQDVPA